MNGTTISVLVSFFTDSDRSFRYSISNIHLSFAIDILMSICKKVEEIIISYK